MRLIRNDVNGYVQIILDESSDSAAIALQAQAAAQAAQAAAETAQTAAELAETNAAGSATAAAASAAASAASEAAAAASQAAAATSATAAANSETAAQAAQSAAETARTAAQAAQTAAEAAQAAAETAETNSAASAAAAAASETAAAASEAAAATDAAASAASQSAAAASATAAASSATLSEAWAESPTEPGGVGTKSAKTWAGESATSATQAEAAKDAVDAILDFTDGNVYQGDGAGIAAFSREDFGAQKEIYVNSVNANYIEYARLWGNLTNLKGGNGLRPIPFNDFNYQYDFNNPLGSGVGELVLDASYRQSSSMTDFVDFIVGVDDSNYIYIRLTNQNFSVEFHEVVSGVDSLLLNVNRIYNKRLSLERSLFVLTAFSRTMRFITLGEETFSTPYSSSINTLSLSYFAIRTNNYKLGNGVLYSSRLIF